MTLHGSNIGRGDTVGVFIAAIIGVLALVGCAWVAQALAG